MSDKPIVFCPEPATSRDCEHGQLARVCEVCELQARLAECERQRDSALLLSINHAEERDTFRAQLAETQKLLEVQLAVVDKLTAEVARLTAQLESRDPTKSQVKRITAMAGVERLEAELAALRNQCERYGNFVVGLQVLVIGLRNTPFDDQPSLYSDGWNDALEQVQEAILPERLRDALGR